MDNKTITGPIATIIVALLICFTLLISSGTFTKSTYATVKYDGGWQRLGDIKSQALVTNAEVRANGQVITKGSFEDVSEWIKNSVENNNSITWKNGVSITAKTAIKWVGSETNFELTIDELKVTSTDAAPVKPIELIPKLVAMKSKTKAEMQKHADESLTYGARPQGSFLINTLLDKLAR
jgi:hypothetical protein